MYVFIDRFILENEFFLDIATKSIQKVNFTDHTEKKLASRKRNRKKRKNISKQRREHKELNSL